MKALLAEHFDLLYSFVLLCVLLTFFWFKPESTKDWVAMVLGAILMRIRPNGNGKPPEAK